jgi:hypothetical protein
MAEFCLPPFLDGRVNRWATCNAPRGPQTRRIICDLALKHLMLFEVIHFIEPRVV